jgi:two-component system, NarL family, sensor histidine kinase UhpB
MALTCLKWQAKDLRWFEIVGKFNLLDRLQQRASPALGRLLTLPGFRRLTLRLRLCLVVAIVLGPALLILASILSLRSISAERTHIEEGLGRTLSQISVEIDREIESTTALLVVLAGSHFLQIGDLESFHRSASEVSSQLGIQFAVRRPGQDNRVVITSVPWSESPAVTIPPIRLEAERQAIKTGQVVISDVFYGPISKRLLVSVIKPVTQDSVVRYVLSIGIPIGKFSEILENAPPGEGRVTVVIDHNNTIIARSEKRELFEGTKVRSEFAALASGSNGVFDYTTREGVALHWVFRRLQSTGWLVAIGLQKTAIDAAARKTFVYTATAGTTLFMLALGLTWILGGRLEQRIGTLGIDRRPTREEFALFFDSAPNGVVLVDENGLMLLTNEKLEQMFGYAQRELIGNAVEILIPNELRDAHVNHRRRFSRGASSRQMGAEQSLLGRRKDGSEFPIEAGLHPITIRAHSYTMATVTDITERTRAAKALAAALTERDRLRLHLMRSFEEERLRLSHELHDRTGQTLIAATLAAKDIEKSLDADGRQRLAKLNGLLDQMGKTLHQVAWELRPASIDELGLAATLENYVSDWSEQTGIDAEFYCKVENIDALPDEVRTTIYRVTQEALTNVAKHARESKKVSVVISRVGATLQLMIDDNGKGFDLAERLGIPNKYRRLGIPSMRERLSLIGGTLEIESSPRAGTTMFARIPLELEQTS